MPDAHVRSVTLGQKENYHGLRYHYNFLIAFANWNFLSICFRAATTQPTPGWTLPFQWPGPCLLQHRTLHVRQFYTRWVSHRKWVSVELQSSSGITWWLRLDDHQAMVWVGHWSPVDMCLWTWLTGKEEEVDEEEQRERLFLFLNDKDICTKADWHICPCWSSTMNTKTSNRSYTEHNYIQTGRTDRLLKLIQRKEYTHTHTHNTRTHTNTHTNTHTRMQKQTKHTH